MLVRYKKNTASVRVQIFESYNQFINPWLLNKNNKSVFVCGLKQILRRSTVFSMNINKLTVNIGLNSSENKTEVIFYK